MQNNSGFFVSTDPAQLDIDSIHAFLSKEAYWCLGIPKEKVRAAIENSLCFGLYSGEKKQIGFARVVTDKSTFAWICDVYVEEKYRGQGLAEWLMKSVMEHSSLQNLRRICLATKDAHALYEKLGFKLTESPGNWMEIKDNDIYRKSTAANK